MGDLRIAHTTKITNIAQIGRGRRLDDPYICAIKGFSIVELSDTSSVPKTLFYYNLGSSRAPTPTNKKAPSGRELSAQLTEGECVTKNYCFLKTSAPPFVSQAPPPARAGAPSRREPMVISRRAYGTPRVSLRLGRARRSRNALRCFSLRSRRYATSSPIIKKDDLLKQTHIY